MGKTSLSNAGGEGSIPAQNAKIPHASWPKKQNINNRGNIVTTSIKTLKIEKYKTSLKEKKKKSPCWRCQNLPFLACFLASLIAQLVKNPPTMQETLVRLLGWEDPLEKG